VVPKSATGTGDIVIDTLTAGTAVSQVRTFLDSDPSVNKTGIPKGYVFKDGLVSFKVTGVTPGATVKVQLLFPGGIPSGSKIYKVTGTGFTEFKDVVISGNAVTLTITDGGSGDADGLANGVIEDPVGVASPGGSGGGGSSGGCFIATAAFGSYLHPFVAVLRTFRDVVLLPSSSGRSFVDWYYRVSPPIAQAIAQNGLLGAGVRLLLLPAIAGAFLCLKLGVIPTLLIFLFLGAAAVAGTRMARRKLCISNQ
jgi:hypothetical protein